MRKLDRESKANKRLSMDNETLMWRLSQPEQDLQKWDAVCEAAGTAEPTRKSRIAVPPRSPRSPTSPRMAANTAQAEAESPAPSTPPKVTLRRSGTYDLLDQEFDENQPTDIKQSDV